MKKTSTKWQRHIEKAKAEADKMRCPKIEYIDTEFGCFTNIATAYRCVLDINHKGKCKFEGRL